MLGVSTLVGTFFLGAYWERSHVNSISAAADNGFDDRIDYFDDSTTIVSDLFPYDYVSVMIGNHSAAFFWRRYLFTNSYTYTVSLGDIQGDPNNPVWVAYDQTFPETLHIWEYDNTTPSNSEFVSTSWENHVLEEPNLRWEIESNTSLLSPLGDTDVVAPLEVQMQMPVYANAYSYRIEVAYSDIIIPAYKGQGRQSYGLPSFGFRGSINYVDSIFTYSGHYRTTENSDLQTLSLTGPAPNILSNSYNRINHFYDLIWHLNGLHPNSDAYWFEDLSYTIVTLAQQPPPTTSTFNFYYITSLANPKFSFKNVSFYLSHFKLIKDETIIVPGGDLAPTDWLGDTIKGVFDVEVFDGLTLGGLFLTIIAVPIVIWILKLFAGG